MSAQYPNVPALPGVPPLARLATAAVVAAGATVAGETQALAQGLGLPATVTFGTSGFYAGLDLQPLLSSSSSQSSGPDSFVPPGALPPYGIFDNGSDWVINPDSVVELDFSADSTINSHPVEPGGSGNSTGFVAYNRVQDPINIRLLLACQGKNMSRSTFLATLEGLREGTQVVTVATPDASYPNMVLKGYGYRKQAEHGAVTIWADTQWSEERSENVVVSAPPTSQPQGATTTNLGSLQPAPATTQQQASISNPPTPPSALPPSYAATQPPSMDAF